MLSWILSVQCLEEWKDLLLRQGSQGGGPDVGDMPRFRLAAETPTRLPAETAGADYARDDPHSAGDRYPLPTMARLSMPRCDGNANVPMEG